MSGGDQDMATNDSAEDNLQLSTDGGVPGDHRDESHSERPVRDEDPPKRASDEQSAIPDTGETNGVADDASRSRLCVYVVDVVEFEPGTVAMLGKVSQTAVRAAPDGSLIFTALASPPYENCCVFVTDVGAVSFAVPESGPTTAEIAGEIVTECLKAHKRHVRAKECKKSYAFGDERIPYGTTTLVKINHDADFRLAEAVSRGFTFSSVHPANASAVERFTFKKGLRGPCWVVIDGVDELLRRSTARPSLGRDRGSQQQSKGPRSWCARELECTAAQVHSAGDSASIIRGLVPGDEAVFDGCPITVMALSVGLSVAERLQEVEPPKPSKPQTDHGKGSATAGGRTTPSTSSVSAAPQSRRDPPAPPAQQRQPATPPGALVISSMSLVVATYANCSALASDTRSDVHVGSMTNSNERCILGRLFAVLGKYDPDAIVGSDLASVLFPTIVERAAALGMPAWTSLGRFRAVPRQGARPSSGLHGRLYCDIVAHAKDSLKKARSFSVRGICEAAGLPVPPGGSMASGTAEAAAGTLDACKALCGLCLPLELSKNTGVPWGQSMKMHLSAHVSAALFAAFSDKGFICPPRSDGPKGTQGRRRKKPQYCGGLNLDPMPGIHDDQAYALVDFRSLYPSIIAEHNLCFTTCTKSPTDPSVLLPPAPSKHRSILNKVVWSFVGLRKAVRADIAKLGPEPDPRVLAVLNTRQLALKCLANSVYGCLAYPNSRFRSVGLASLITRLGREALKDAVERLGCGSARKAVFGDTDSVAVGTGVSLPADAARAEAKRLADVVSEGRTHMAADIAAIYRTMFVVKKKRFVGWKLDDAPDKPDIKGLEVVRRDYCKLGTDVCLAVIAAIGNGIRGDRLSEVATAALEAASQRLSAGAVPVADLAIVNEVKNADTVLARMERVRKAGSDVGETCSKTTPHVRVAIRDAARGRLPPPGMCVAYVVPAGEGKPLDRAISLDEALDLGAAFAPDVEFYLSKQVHAPVSRLLGAAGASGGVYRAPVGHAARRSVPAIPPYPSPATPYVHLVAHVSCTCGAANTVDRLVDAGGRCERCTELVPMPVMARAIETSALAARKLCTAVGVSCSADRCAYVRYDCTSSGTDAMPEEGSDCPTCGGSGTIVSSVRVCWCVARGQVRWTLTPGTTSWLSTDRCRCATWTNACRRRTGDSSRGGRPSWHWTPPVPDRESAATRRTPSPRPSTISPGTARAPTSFGPERQRTEHRCVGARLYVSFAASKINPMLRARGLLVGLCGSDPPKGMGLTGAYWTPPVVHVAVLVIVPVPRRGLQRGRAAIAFRLSVAQPRPKEPPRPTRTLDQYPANGVIKQWNRQSEQHRRNTPDCHGRSNNQHQHKRSDGGRSGRRPDIVAILVRRGRPDAAAHASIRPRLRPSDEGADTDVQVHPDQQIRVATGVCAVEVRQNPTGRAHEQEGISTKARPSLFRICGVSVGQAAGTVCTHRLCARVDGRSVPVRLAVHGLDHEDNEGSSIRSWQCDARVRVRKATGRLAGRSRCGDRCSERGAPIH
jgi:DNA polymerase elongation subunit (family B)